MPENQHDIHCGECGADMVLRRSRYGPFYGCTAFPRCKGTHGCHPNLKPMGIPADKETKLLRMDVHAIFDKLWPEVKDRTKCSKRRAKGLAYNWLATFMDMTRDEAHIGRFTADECRTFLSRASSIDTDDVVKKLVEAKKKRKGIRAKNE